MDSRYNFSDSEARVYKMWQENNLFAPSEDRKDKEKFCIIMPPPNANDPLHAGHAMFITIEDILIRYQRMLGKDTVWIPGTDHAGIETQFVFEKKLKKQNQSRFDFDRNTLYQKIANYTQENSEVALDQMKKIGASADWGRFVYTLDKEVVDQVVETFVKLEEDGLVYRDQQIVNYCTHCGTSFSNLEVEYETRNNPFYYIKYGPFTIATVRPETKFRDTALAVHPEDKRYKSYIGTTLKILGLLGDIKMTVIADDQVDPEFGTGIMKVTPAHDPHDFELAKKHNLPILPIITTSGKMDFSWYIKNKTEKKLTALDEKYLARAKKYHNKSVHAMRQLMREDLDEDDLLIKIDNNYQHKIGVCYRCKRPIEPLPLPQFFIKTKPLVEPVLQEIKKKNLKIFGAGHDKILLHWLQNIRDWNVSRQIVWGIRMPVWYNIEENPDLKVAFINKKQELVVDEIKKALDSGVGLSEIIDGLQQIKAPLNCNYKVSARSPGANFIQDTDTFDTWFSSSQWPVVTLKASELKYNNAKDFERFYPTQVMETGYDILPFWVMRMLFMGMWATKKLPFNKVYFHGLVRDGKGQKMSKSKGNVINPLEIVDKYGADSLRLSLVIRSSAGLDKSVGEADFRASRNLSNKIWNASRYILGALNQEDLADDTAGTKIGEKYSDTKQPSKYKDDFENKIKEIIAESTKNLDEMKIGVVADNLYKHFWHWFCDDCIEKHKQKTLDTPTLLLGLVTFLKLLHPFMPFVTEAIWQELRKKELVKEQFLITALWPK